uniref:Xeroderma pigmentosum, complementation group C n=1 Tax=Gadus morhua TaxID=8049 RepID=A0A8C5BA55_GADMO
MSQLSLSGLCLPWPGNGLVEEEEKLVRKVSAKTRGSSTRTAVSTTSTTSKYFPSPPKKKALSNNHDNEDGDLHMVTMATPILPMDVTGPSRPKKEDSEEEDESEEDDWEDVEELSGPLGPAPPAEPSLPTQAVEIEIETPELIRMRQKKSKRKAEFEQYLKRMVNRLNKDLLEDTHKVHLMCLIANGMFRNRLCSEPDLLAITLSLLPPHFMMVAKERIDHNYLSGLLKWFGATFTLNPSLPHVDLTDPRGLLERRLASLSARDHQEMTHVSFLSGVFFFLQGKGSESSGGRTPGKSPGSGKSPKGSPPDSKISPGNKRPALVSAATAGKGRGASGGKRAKKGGGQRPKNAKRRSVASKVSYKEESGSGEDVLSDGEEEEEEEEFQATGEEDSEEEEVEGGRAKHGKGRREGTKGKRRSGGGGGRKKRDGPGADEWLEVFVEKTSAWLCVDAEHGVDRPQLCWRNATQPMAYVVAVDGDGRLKDLGRKYDPTWMTSSRKRRVDDEWWGETLTPFLPWEGERDDKEEKELQAKLLDRPMPTSIAELKNHPMYALTRHLLKYEALYPPTAAVLGYCRGEPVYSRDCVHQLHSRETWLKEARTVRIGEEPFKMVKGFSNRSRKARMMVEQKEEKDLALYGEWQTEEYQPPIAVEGKVPRNEYGNVYLFKPCMLPVGCVHLRLPTLNRVARKLDMDAAPAVTGFDFHGGYSHAVTDGYIVCEEHEEILRAAWEEDQALQKQKEIEKREKRATTNWKLLVKGLLIRERLQLRYGKKGQGLGGAGGSSQGHGQDGEGVDGLSADEEELEGGVPVEDPGDKTPAEMLAKAWPQNRQDEGEEEGGGKSRPKRKITQRERKCQEKTMFPFEKA